MPIRCENCGEYMPIPHNCDKAREARALLEASKRANDPESAMALGSAAYAKAIEAEL